MVKQMASGFEDFGIVDDEAPSPTVGAEPSARDSKPPPPPGAPQELAVEHTPGGTVIQRNEVLPEVFSTVPLFSGLLPAHLRRMAMVSAFVEFKKNDYVFRHGDEGDGLYIVHSGSVRISRNASGMGEEALAIIRDGGHFGEMSLIDDDVPRSADAIAHENSVVVKLAKNDMRDLLFVDRELAYELLWRFVRTLSGRLRESNDRLMMLTASSKF
jgi:CRP/FNR family cyclic AMP-dependent transcriptional regulator